MIKTTITNRTMSHLFFTLKITLPILFLMFLIDNAYSQQVPMKARDSKSLVNVSGFEKINLSNGNFSFNLPLASVGGRGVGNGVLLNIEQKWRKDEIVVGYSGATPNVVTRIDTDPFIITGIKPQTGGYLVGHTKVIQTEEIGLCSNETITVAEKISFSLNFTGFGGQGFSFVSQENEGQPLSFPVQSGNPCLQRTVSVGQVFISTDGSGAKFIADSALTANNYDVGGQMIVPSGVIKTTSGATYRIDNGLVSWMDDKNGNRTVVTMSGYTSGDSPATSRLVSVKDSLNREIQVSSIDAQWFQYVTYKGVGGTTRTIKIFYDDLSNSLRSGQSIQRLSSLFPATVSYSQNLPDREVNPKVIKYAEMPDGRRYNFKYNSYAELARVELPTGGAIEYDFETIGGTISGGMDRRIIERRIYSNGTNLDNKTQYVYSHSVPNIPYQQIPSETNTTVKLYDNQNALKSVSKSYFYGCIQDGSTCYIPAGWYEPESAQKYLAGREFKSETYASEGTTLLRKTETAFGYRTRANWSPLLPETPYRDYRVTSVTNTLIDSGQISKVTYGYDSTEDFNLLTDTYEYDYGLGQVGSFIRRSHTEFKKDSAFTNNNVNLRTLPIESWVSSDINGNTKVSRIQYEYDNYSSGTYTAPLTNRTNITGHNSSYGTGYTTRGNITKVTNYADAQNQTGAVSVYTQYDIAGNIVKTFDAKGNASIISYNDNFGFADAEARTTSAPSLLNGQQTFAFATSATNVAGYTTYAQFDYYSGAGVDAEDINGNVSTTFYNDILDRPTQTISANNHTTFRRQTTAVYDDVNRKVTITTDSKSFGDNLIKSQAFFDGLGRTTEGREYEDATNYVAVLTEYDSLGRAYKSSNPYRPILNEQPQWTITSFDDLGRVTEVKSPNNGKITKTYYGSSVRIFDQANRSRAGVSDALGRLIKVVEYDDGADLETFYTYDVLGRLRKTAQGGQNRYFMYNDLGRLIRAKQPEQNANTNLNLTDPITGNSSWSVKYDYDNNGNAISTTDARNITVTGTYDNLNRLTARDYSDSTPDVSFTFDDPNIANSKGQLTAVVSSVSANYYTAFDQLGRIKSSSQVTNGQTYNFPNYTYDLSGALVEQTYPSGRVVKTESDNIGRLSKVTSQIPNQAERTYINNISYTAFGAISRARLGNGRWESAEFDAKTMQVTQIGLGYSIGNTSQLKIEYNYGTTTSTTSDNNGSLRQQKISYAGQSATIIQDYTYDYLNRLKSATETVSGSQTWKQTFTYDRFGNRRFDAANTTTLIADNGIYNPQIDTSTNKFLVSEGYNYDNEGNLTSNPESQLFQYDANNRQTQVTNTASQTTANYFYDGSGKRIRKVFGQQETIFVYDAFGKMIAEYATTLDTSRPKTISYLTTDTLGSPRVITDNGGVVVSRHDYRPFGEEISANVGGRLTDHRYQANDGVRQQFTSYERDKESGLDYAQARYFSSKHGRFTSVDPLTASANMKNPQTFNRYSYALNSPYKFTDPLGLKPCGQAGDEKPNGDACTQADDTRDDCGAYGERQTSGCQEDDDNDDRPYMGDMVDDEADHGWDPFDFYPNDPETHRFGGGHDGEHWLTIPAVTNIRATQGINGTVLTYYSQGGGLWTVFILLSDGKNVLILKDVQNLSAKVRKAPQTNSKNTRFTDSKGNPISKVVLKAGDVIGQTSSWRPPGEVGIVSWENSYGTFHFVFIKFEFAQKYRTLKGESYGSGQQNDIAEDSDIIYRKGTPVLKDNPSTTAFPRSWFVNPCGAASPVRCQ